MKIFRSADIIEQIQLLIPEIVLRAVCRIILRRIIFAAAVLIQLSIYSPLFQIADTADSFGGFPCPVQRRQQHSRQNGNDSNHHKDNLSNILICSILAMTRKKAEGELSDESVDLCTAKQREG